MSEIDHMWGKILKQKTAHHLVSISWLNSLVMLTILYGSAVSSAPLAPAYRLQEILNGRLLAADTIATPDPFLDGSLAIVSDDETKGYVMPWSFPFYGVSYNEVGVDSNGTLWLGNINRNQPHLNLAFEGPLISPWSNDLDASSNGQGVQVEHKTSPERVVFHWQTTTYCNSRDINEFEVVLYPNGYILFRYLTFGNTTIDEGSGISSGPGNNDYLDLTQARGSVYRLGGHAYLFEADLGQVAGITDADADGIDDGMESALGFDPTLADTDGDGVKDGWEYYLFGNDPSTTSVMNLSVPTLSITEGNSGSKTANLTLQLMDAAPHRPFRVDFQTADDSAVAGSDYLSASGSLVFQSGQTTASIPITVIGDTVAEGDETLRLVLSSPDPNIDILGGGGWLVLKDDDSDSDHDGVVDISDNCTWVPNTSQLDADADHYGNACDGDLSGDGQTDSLDFVYFMFSYGTSGSSLAADFNGDGQVDIIDASYFFFFYGYPPGPSGLIAP